MGTRRVTILHLPIFISRTKCLDCDIAYNNNFWPPNFAIEISYIYGSAFFNLCTRTVECGPCMQIKRIDWFVYIVGLWVRVPSAKPYVDATHVYIYLLSICHYLCFVFLFQMLLSSEHFLCLTYRKCQVRFHYQNVCLLVSKLKVLLWLTLRGECVISDDYLYGEPF